MASKIKVDTIENVAGSGNVSLGSGHNLVVPGDLTVDTNVLKVDSTNNRVGINTTSGPESLNIGSGGNLRFQTNDKIRIEYLNSTGAYSLGTTGGAALGFEYISSGADHEIFFETHNGGVSHAERMRINKDGYVTTPNQPAFRTGLNTTRTATGSEEVITWTNEQFDIGNNWNGSRFTAPVSGRYLFMLNWLSINDSSHHDISISINGSIANGQRSRNPNSGQHETTSMSVIFNLNVNDYVESVMGASGHKIYGDASVYWTSFQGYLLG